MGQDKALVEVDGAPILQRVYRVANECGDRVYVLTPWRDRYEEILPGDCRWLVESNPGGGPMSGFAQGLDRIECEWLLLLGCDLPLLRSDILQNWIERLETLPDSTLAMVPKQAAGWEPLCGFYRKAIAPELRQFMESGGRSFQRWLPQINVEEIAPDSEAVLMLKNINTPQDLERLGEG